MTTTPSRVPAALVTGAATVLYYASPDVVRSRTARGWLKAGLTAVTLAASVPEFRAVRAAARAQDEREGQDGAGIGRDDVAAMPTGRKVAGLAIVGAVITSTVGVIVATERWIFRRGEARAAVGRRLPHTQAALLLGALAAGLAFVPSPDDSGDPVDVAEA